MSFINKKAHNVRQDRFNKLQVFKTEDRHEIIKPEVITPIVIEPEIVETTVIEGIELPTVEKEVLTPQPKKKKKKTQENNNIETI